MKLASDLDTVKENPPPSVGGQLPIPREPEGKKKKKGRGRENSAPCCLPNTGCWSSATGLRFTPTGSSYSQDGVSSLQIAARATSQPP